MARSTDSAADVHGGVPSSCAVDAAVLCDGRQARASLPSRRDDGDASRRVWDSQDEFGDTNLLVSTTEQGRSTGQVA